MFVHYEAICNETTADSTVLVRVCLVYHAHVLVHVSYCNIEERVKR